MNRVRVIPVLLLDNDGLYKTKSFKNPVYIGDPINAVKLFNDKEVDELIIIDYTARAERREINYQFIEEIVSEAFMPICYGGAIDNMQQCEKLIKLGVEKICLNFAAANNPPLIGELAQRYGSQSVVASVDIRRNLLVQASVYISRGTEKIKTDPVEYCKQLADAGAGELLVTNIDREGTKKGYDLEILKKISDAVTIPVIANGGAASLSDMLAAIKKGHASAVAAGSMFVFYGKLDGILINYPSQEMLTNEIFKQV
jgi:imidazole glycerol-phosphate synthase subunit HisF